MKTDQLEMTLYFDFYGDLLTDKQKTCFDLYYNQDLSLSEIAQLEGVSRQGVHDALSRAEAQLIQLERVTGCVRTARRIDRAVRVIDGCAERLLARSDSESRALAGEIRAALAQLKE